MNHDVLIVGAGLSGLSCAWHLQQAGIKPLLLEASDAIGGRVRTDRAEGFQLDRGFQVLLTSYPEAKRVLDYSQLELEPFQAGALIRYKGAFHELADPWRRPFAGIRSLTTPIGSVADKFRVARFRANCVRRSPDSYVETPSMTALQSLKNAGFSPSMLERFLRPFLGGIFLENQLDTPDSMLKFVFKMFATGDACLPAAGMEAIPKQLASSLPAASIRFQCRVVELRANYLKIESGEIFEGTPIVIACDAPNMSKLIDQHGFDSRDPGRGVSCIYYSASTPPISQPILVLNGDGHGPINNLCVPTLIAPTYGPGDKHLVSVTVLGYQHDPQRLQTEVERQLSDWFGSNVKTWEHLRTYVIPYALSPISTMVQGELNGTARHSPNVYMCGDHLGNPSIQGALASGHRAAQAVLDDLRNR